jgi:hypothetical protein
MKIFNKIIDYANLDKDLKSKFLNNNPFPFIILDNFLKNDYFTQLSKSLSPYKHMKLNFKNHWFRHGTTFVLVKISDYLKKQNVPYLKSYLRYKFKKFISIN